MPFKFKWQIIMALSNIFSKYMGIDLGTANTLVFVKDKGIIIRESSVVAIDNDTKKVLAVGEEAKSMIGRTPGNIVAIRPLKDGVIADFEVTRKMIRYFIERAMPNRGMFSSLKVAIGVPSGVTEVEKRAIVDVATLAGAKDVLLLEEPMAAAIGANLPVAEATGSMIIDIGGGTTEIAIISLGGIVVSCSVKVAGDEFDNAIINYIRKEYSMVIGERTAENIKVTIGSAYLKEEDEKMEIIGRNLMTGLPNNITISSSQILEALSEPISIIIENIKSTLEKTPPELSADIMLHGIVLAGGGANLYGLDKLIEKETKMPVYKAENPIECVAIGTGKAIESYETLKGVFLKTRKIN